MKLSTGVEWALHCCVVLSQADAPLTTARLAELHGVSSTYLAKQMQTLSRAGLVRSTEGRDGGYSLTKAAASVSVLDVVKAVDGKEPAFRCTEIRQQGVLAIAAQDCKTPCGIAKVMAKADQAWRQSLAGVSIADLAATIDTGQLKKTLGQDLVT